MTPAIRVLEEAGVEHTVLHYDLSERRDRRDVGRAAAAALGLPEQQVFKTLVVEADGDLAVVVIPVAATLAPKRAAAALGVKRVTMCDPAAAERSSGYVVGGISPLGQKRRLPTVVDRGALDHDRVFVSAGRRGLEVSLAPADLVRLLDATVAPVTA